MKAKASTQPTDQTRPTDPTTETRDLYNDLATGYDTHYTLPVHEAEDEATCLLLNPLVLSALKTPEPFILDLGCGTGWLLDNFPCLRPSQYFGIDLSPSMVATARAKHPNHNFIQCGILDFPTHIPATLRVRPTLIVSTFGTLSHLLAESWVPVLSELAVPSCSYFLTLLTAKALTRPSSLAHTHPHLIHPISSPLLHTLLVDHHLPPSKIFGLNPWGDTPPPHLEWASPWVLAQAMCVDAFDSRQAPGHIGRRHLLGVIGKRI